MVRAFLFLLALSRASAQEPDFETLIRDQVQALKPAVRAAPRIGTWKDPPRYGWLDSSTFLGPFGLRLDRSCMAYEGAAYPAVPGKFVTSAREMHDRLQSCASTRVVRATVGLLYERMSRARVLCDPKACKYEDETINAYACADSDKLEIKFPKADKYIEPGTLFHELVHSTRHVDNQSFEDHSHHGKNPLRDEIYFWERHCFEHADLVRRMREALLKDAEKEKLDFETQSDLKRVNELAFEVCARPFRYNVRRKLRSTEREIEGVCGQYAAYLMMEINMARQVRALTAAAGVCNPAADRAECPKAAFFTPGTPEYAALAQAGLFPPPLGPYSPEAFGVWTDKACSYFNGSSNTGNPSWTLSMCAERLDRRARDTAAIESLFAAEVSWEDIGKIQSYFARLAAKSRALAEGPGRYENALSEAGEAFIQKYYKASLNECEGAAIKGTSFCRDLALDSPAMRLLGLMYLHWHPKTL